FVTEALWAENGKIGSTRDRLLVLSSWPEMRGLEDAAAEREMQWLIELVSGIRSVRTEMNVPAGAKIDLRVVGGGTETGLRVGAHGAAIQRLARLESIATAPEVPKDSAQIVLNEATFALPLAGVIDIAAERARLERDVAKIDDEVERIERKLSNEQFVAKAPPEVIEEQRSRRAEALARRQKLLEAISRLS